MSEKKKSDGLNRRQFITGAGSALLTGAVTALATRDATGKEGVEAESGAKPKPVPVSGLIVHNPKACAGCGVCNMMCSLQHHGESGLSLSNAQLVRDPFNGEYAFNVCQQCRSPGCYYACPEMDSALCIDPKTGATYVNPDECIGCGQCIDACPFEPKRIKLHPVEEVSLVCDLCRGRGEGPICAEYCPMKALTYVSGNERSG